MRRKLESRTGDDVGEDDELVANFLAGTGDGLQAVYAAYGKLMYAVARNALGDDADAQDCVHDVLMRVWQHSASYRRERGALRGYLLVAVRNDALTRRRNAARRLAIDTRIAREEQPEYEIDVSDPIEGMRLRRALAGLPAEQKSALELAYFGQLTHVEVAERLGVPLGTIKSRIALALRKLHSALTEKETGAP